MMALEVKAASKRKNRANPRSSTMRDSVYEVKSPWSMQYTEFRLHFQAIFVLSNGILLIYQCHAGLCGQQDSLIAALKQPQNAVI